ncbi:MAG: O-antigen ligase family protein [Verrucomicrobiales bacterium]
MRGKLPTLWILGLTLLPMLSGQDLERWMIGLVMAGMGVAFLAAPPRKLLHGGVHWVCLALVAVACAAFLPARWFGIPAWRTHALEIIGLELPSTLSPQPWFSLDYLCILIAGLLWVYYLSSRRWHREERLLCMQTLALTIVGVAVVSLVGFAAEWRPPGWGGQNYLGPFANRNQVAVVLAAGAVLVGGIGHCELRSHHRKRALCWFSCLTILFACIVLNGSRAGIFCFFGGLGLWVVFLFIHQRSSSLLAVAGSALLILAAAFFLYGGDLLDRLRLDEGNEIATVVKEERRIPIFRESLALIRQAPLVGIGLGNFAPVYALNRKHTTSLDRVAQPDSDYLWLGVEMGLPALVLVLYLLLLLANRARPFSSKSRHGKNFEHLRGAALIAAAVFAADAVINIPGHRLGVALVAILVLALGLRSHRRDCSPKWLPPAYQGAGLALLGTGLLWAGAAWTGIALPGPIGVENLSQRAQAARYREDHAAAHALIDRAIGFEPLRYVHYYKRALYLADAGGDIDEVVADFRIARYLEPIHPVIPHEEMKFWLGLRPSFALEALGDLMARDPIHRDMYFLEVLDFFEVDPRLQEVLAEMAATSPDLLLRYLERLPNARFNAHLESLLAEGSTLERFDKQERNRLAQLWYRKGPREDLVEFLEADPSWTEAGWEQLARIYAADHDFLKAFDLAIQYLEPPQLPRSYGSRNLEEARRAFLTTPDDIAAGINLYHLEKELGEIESALSTLERVSEVPASPHYVSYLLAIGYREREEGEPAWKHLLAYLSASRT